MKQVTTPHSGSVYDAWLASACMPPSTVRQIIEKYNQTESIFHAFQRKDEWLFNIVTPRFAGTLKNNSTEEKMKYMQSVIEKQSISVCRYDDPHYPSSLRNTDEPPVILFYQGNIQCLEHKMLSMVGSRAASYTGQKAARKLACDLSRHGITVVSGLACGIDAASHEGCIEGGSPTIAVTACGLDIVYPKENTRLRNMILEKDGLIMTEYAPGEKPAGWHFPFRNRIIAGLGQALILVEARIKSGSMTSVQHALEQGKDIFVYPGDPDSEHFEGNHQLLREGGIFFTGAEDILSDLDWLDNQPAVRQNSDCSIDTRAVTPEQSAVIGALKPGKLSFEQILETTGMDPAALLSNLTILQISGVIEPLPGKQYQLRH